MTNEELKSFTNAMVLDNETSKPKPRVSADRQQKTVQTQAGVSVAAASWATGTWLDVIGFDKLALTFANDAASSSDIWVQWSNDGTNVHGDENIIPSSSARYKQAETPIKAQYARVSLYNGDAVAHIMSAWTYLKA